MSRAESVAEAQRLRAEGLTVRTIAERMGASRTAVGSWLADPDLSKQRARRERYAGRCDECGGSMDGSNGYRDCREGRVCSACRSWTDDELIAAIQRWAACHDGKPPREVDFRLGTNGYPSGSAISGRFGWSRALKLAGFTPHQDKSPERQAWIEQQLRSGRAVAEIAADLGVSRHAIHTRMHTRGTTVGALRRKAGVA